MGHMSGERMNDGRGQQAANAPVSPQRDRARLARTVVRPADFRRFLRQVSLSVLVPGVGLIAAGRKWLGGLVLGVFLLGGVSVVVYAIRAGRSGLVRLGSDPERLGLLGIGLASVAAVWLILAVIGLYLLQPSGLRFAQRLLSAFLVVAVGSMIVAPLSIGSMYAFTQRDLIDSVFADEEDQHSLTIPEDATTKDPWAGHPRVNVLILGADSGDDRDGTRTDTVMVASIDTETGDTALFALPRNLQHTPMPEGPLRDAYPDGYRGPEEDAYYWLSSIYRNLPAEFPDYFEGIADPGAEALKLVVGEALGLDISYYVMVNLRGFQYLVDALGGVDLDVPYRIPIGTRAIEGVGCTRATGWIEPGEDQHLDGYHALWFARARCGPGPINDDYERMRRQRCVIGAIVSQADPFNLLTRYQRLAAAAKDTMSTDIGRRRLADFAELALKVQEAGIRSLPFTNEIVSYNNPDFELIRRFVQSSLEPPDEPELPSPAPGTGTSGSAEPEESAAPEERGGSPDPSGAETPGSPGEPLGEATGDASPRGTESPGGESPGAESPGAERKPDESDGAQSIDEVC